MGEHATYNGEEIKIGTCEEMYYLRHDQRHLISDYEFGPLDRFRFPFPDEDHIEPGQFDDHDRGVQCYGWRIPTDWGDGHGAVQFIASSGYNLCIDCPEAHSAGDEVGAIDVNGIKVHRNGWSAWPRVVQQRAADGVLATIVKCGACGAKWRIPDLETARPIIDGLIAEAERTTLQRTDVVFPEGDDYPKAGSYTDSPTYEWLPANSPARIEFLREVARRIEGGYRLTKGVA